MICRTYDGRIIFVAGVDLLERVQAAPAIVTGGAARGQCNLGLIPGEAHFGLPLVQSHYDKPGRRRGSKRASLMQ